MSTTVTLSSLITSVRQRSDTESTQTYSDAEITGYINASYAELYDLLIQKYGDNYFVNSPAPDYTFVTDGTNELYNLPSDFYKLLGVDLYLSSSPDSKISIKPFSMGDRNRFSVPNFQSFYGVTNLRYRIHGNQIWLNPRPAVGQTIGIIYIPRITYLVNPGDTLDGISGWEEYVIIDAAMKVLIKDETDIQPLVLQKQAMIQRIESAAENRDAGSPPKVVDAMYNDFWWPTGNGSGYNGSY